MAVANQTPRDVASEYATLAFIVQQLTAGMGTATLVRVKACTNNGGLVPVGTLDAQLLVDMVAEDGQTFPQGTVFKVPYMRMQGGTDAVILDPVPGDLGVCVFASRDISAIKSDPNAARDRKPNPGAPPGSKRMFSLSDALYIGGMLNGTPTQYVQFERGEGPGINVVSPSRVTVQAPLIELKGRVEQSDGDVTMAQALDVQGNVHSAGTITGDVDVIADNISGKTHTHNDPQGGVVGPPNP